MRVQVIAHHLAVKPLGKVNGDLQGMDTFGPIGHRYGYNCHDNPASGNTDVAGILAEQFAGFNLNQTCNETILHSFSDRYSAATISSQAGARHVKRRQ
jgi:hypothetical protein